MQLAAVTNEVAPQTEPGSLRRIIETAVAAGITTFEVRTVEARRFPLLTSGAWRVLRQAPAEYGLRYSVASPGCFIGVEADCEMAALHRDRLWPMSMEMADALEIDTLITFAPRRAARPFAGEFDRVVELLGGLADSASERGFDVQLENLPGSWADTGTACHDLLEAVNRRNLGQVWDSGNFYETEGGAPFETTLDLLWPHIRNVHLKDGGFENGRMVWQRYGEGETGIDRQIAALKARGYKGTIALEAARIPHIEGDFEASLDYLRNAA